MNHGLRFLLLGLVGMLDAGCPAASSMSRPESVVQAYGKALRDGDYGRAYELMSPEYRKEHSREEFIRALTARKAELRRSGDPLQGAPRQTKVEARVDYGEGDSLTLRLTGGTWLIATDPVDFYSQRTPAEALRSFVRAIERHRYDVVMRFVPNKWVESMTVEKLRQQWEGEKQAEVVALIKTLKLNLKAPIRGKGDTATMPYGDHFEVRFLREDGVWKIEDPD